jgi:hypothetical protein
MMGRLVNFFDVVTKGWHARYVYWHSEDSVTERPISAIPPSCLLTYLQRSVRFIMSLSSAALSHIASSNSSAQPATDIFKGHVKTDTVEDSVASVLLHTYMYIHIYIQWDQNLVKVTL